VKCITIAVSATECYQYILTLFIYNSENSKNNTAVKRAMAVNCPYIPNMAFKKPGKIIHEKILSSSVN